MKMSYAPMVMAVMSALVVMTPGLTGLPATTSAAPMTWTRTTGPPGQNLNGQMFTLSNNRGGIFLYSPYYISPSSPPWPSTPYYQTRRYTTPDYPRPTTVKPRTTTSYYPRTTTSYYPRTTTSYYPWTTAPPTRGVSVCLRYMIDQQAGIPTMFTLSPGSRNPLSLGVGYQGQYSLTFNRYYYNSLVLKPYIRLWSNVGMDIWTRVCIILDTGKRVAQVFSGSRMSIRKRLPVGYTWSGGPAIDFQGFDGQVTDIQIWDYPLQYREILRYMDSAFYGPSSGSVLTWSDIIYSPRGDALLEPVYERQANRPVGISRRGRRPKGEKKTREVYVMGERKERKRQLL